MGNVPALRWGPGFSWGSIVLVINTSKLPLTDFLKVGGWRGGKRIKTCSFLIAPFLGVQGPANLISGQVLNHLGLGVAGTKSK